MLKRKQYAKRERDTVVVIETKRGRRGVNKREKKRLSEWENEERKKS